MLQAGLLHLLQGVLAGLLISLGPVLASLVQAHRCTGGVLLQLLDELIAGISLLRLLLTGELLLLTLELLLLPLGLLTFPRLHLELGLLLLLLLRTLHLLSECRRNESARSEKRGCDEHLHEFPFLDRRLFLGGVTSRESRSFR